MTEYDDNWTGLCSDAQQVGLCPRTDAARWAAWMQANGYARRMHGGFLNKSIVDALVRSWQQNSAEGVPALADLDPGPLPGLTDERVGRLQALMLDWLYRHATPEDARSFILKCQPLMPEVKS